MTKTVPKELLPIVDTPIILFILEEILSAGIEEVIFVQGRGKSAIDDYFDRSVELESVLQTTHKEHLLARVTAIRDRVKIMSIRQKEALGLGHAVLTAEPAVGNEPFAVLLGDELMLPRQGLPSAIGQLSKTFEETGRSTVAIMEVAKEDVQKYGICAGEPQGDLLKITDVIEKPEPAAAPSRWALPGRYVFDPRIFSYLRDTAPGKNGEIQLTDAMRVLAKNDGLFGMSVKARRFDAGDKLGYLQANVELGLEHPEIGKSFKNYLKKLLENQP